MNNIPELYRVNDHIYMTTSRVDYIIRIMGHLNNNLVLYCIIIMQIPGESMHIENINLR
jgi:hypothetical protein